MVLPTERDLGRNVKPDLLRLPEYKGSVLEFEGVKIQMDKGGWSFTHPDKGPVTIDTYSIWNPHHRQEIAERLFRGQVCAMYIMGNYGVGQVRVSPEWNQGGGNKNVILDEIKKRARVNNLVAFVDPDDVYPFIDKTRLPQELKGLRWAKQRYSTYAGPQHNIVPVVDNGTVDKDLVREGDKTMAVFWIPGHWGYEEIGDKLRKLTKHGIFGGGSLNIHGEAPCYTTRELYHELSAQPDWQENIDFIILDELAESYRVGRSQTMVSFATFPPEAVRIGSLSVDKINEKTGAGIVENGEVKEASSLTKYNMRNNAVSDGRVEGIMAKIKRYKEWYRANFERRHEKTPSFPQRPNMRPVLR